MTDPLSERLAREAEDRFNNTHDAFGVVVAAAIRAALAEAVKPIHAALEKARTNFHDAGCHGRLCDCDPLHVSGGPCCHAGLVVDEVRALVYPLLSAAAIEAL